MDSDRQDRSPELRQLLLQSLPTPLSEEILALKKRLAPQDLDALVERICKCKPLSKIELATILKKDDGHMRGCLRRMLNAGRLQYLYPDIPQHPQQKYVSPRGEDLEHE